MALISSKNLAAPLTNKTHITTIVLVAMVFAVFRLSGGGIDIKNTNKNYNKKTTSSLNSLPVKKEVAPSALSPQAPQKNSGVFDFLNRNNSQEKSADSQRARPNNPAPWGANPPEKTNTDSASKPKSLDDIRRMMGGR